jgi:hypothetical protein
MYERRPPPRAAVARRPVGAITRGTTNHNRLRRVDRWFLATYGGVLRAGSDPLVVDVGYGASPVTTVELFERLRVARPDVRVVGLEIDQARVDAALPYQRDGLRFARGGFELPLPGRRSPLLVRAFNVLRQYPESEVAPTWRMLCDRLAPGGLLVEGTCDELGRLACWVTLDAAGPRTLTMAARLASLSSPAALAERLPKALIHRNVPGERINAWFADAERAWALSAPEGVFGRRQRWTATIGRLASRWPVLDRADRWRQGEVTIAWEAVG